MTVKEIKKKLSKKAIIFKTGGKRPTGELLESWIGSVRWQQAIFIYLNNAMIIALFWRRL